MAIFVIFHQHYFHTLVLFMNSFTTAVIFLLITAPIVILNIQRNSACVFRMTSFSPFALEFLIDFLECTPQTNIQQPLLFPVIQLCGFLLIECCVIYEIIQVHVYVPSFLRRPSSSTHALVDKLTRSGYHQLGQQFSSTYFLFQIMERPLLSKTESPRQF